MNALWPTRYAPYPPMQGGNTQYSRELVHSLARRAVMCGLGFEMEGVKVPAYTPMTWQTVPYRRNSNLRGLLPSLLDVAFRFQQDAASSTALKLAAEAEAKAVFVDFIGNAVRETAYRHPSIHYDWDGQGEGLLAFPDIGPRAGSRVMNVYCETCLSVPEGER